MASSVVLLSLAVISFARHYSRAAIQYAAFVAISIPLALLALSTIQSTLVPRYFLTSLPFLHLLMSDGAAILVRWRAAVGGIIVTLASAGTILQGQQTLVSERKFEIRPLVQFLDEHDTGDIKDVVILGPGRRRGDPLVNDRHFARILDFYLHSEFSVKNERFEEQKGLQLADRLARTPALWLLVRAVEGFRLGEDLPSDAAACQWVYRDIQIILVARSRQSLPGDLKKCRPHNGYL